MMIRDKFDRAIAMRQLEELVSKIEEFDKQNNTDDAERYHSFFTYENTLVDKVLLNEKLRKANNPSCNDPRGVLFFNVIRKK